MEVRAGARNATCLSLCSLSCCLLCCTLEVSPEVSKTLEVSRSEAAERLDSVSATELHGSSTRQAGYGSRRSATSCKVPGIAPVIEDSGIGVEAGIAPVIEDSGIGVEAATGHSVSACGKCNTRGNRRERDLK